MKKFIVLLVIVISVSTIVPIFAQDNYKVIDNGSDTEIVVDQQPIYQGDVTIDTNVSSIEQEVKKPTTNKHIDVSGIEQEIKRLVANKDVAFYYEDLTSSEVYAYNETTSFPSASTTKTPLALYAYTLASQGKLDLDEKMTYKSNHYYGGSGIIQYDKTGTTYTLRELVEKLIIHSDNIAYRMLKEKLGEDNFIKFTTSIGATLNSNFNPKEISCHLKALKIFCSDNKELGKELSGYFANTVYRERIPKALESMVVLSKVGMLPLENIYHDSAIVLDENPYILIIMTKGNRNNQADFFIELTKLIQQRHTVKRKELAEPSRNSNFVENENGNKKDVPTGDIPKEYVPPVPSPQNNTKEYRMENKEDTINKYVPYEVNTVKNK